MLQTNQKLNWKTPWEILNLTFIWISKAMRLKIANGFTEGHLLCLLIWDYTVCLEENVNRIILCEMSPTRKCLCSPLHCKASEKGFKYEEDYLNF